MSNVNNIVEYLADRPDYTSRKAMVLKKFPNMTDEEWKEAKAIIKQRLKGKPAQATASTPNATLGNVPTTNDVTTAVALAEARIKAELVGKSYEAAKRELDLVKASLKDKEDKIKNLEDTIRSQKHTIEDADREHKNQLAGITKESKFDKLLDKVMDDPAGIIQSIGSVAQGVTTPAPIAPIVMWLKNQLAEDPQKIEWIKQVMAQGYLDQLYQEAINQSQTQQEV